MAKKTSVEIGRETFNRGHELLGAESIGDTPDAALLDVLRGTVVRGLVTLAEEGAFSALLESDIEERMWGSSPVASGESGVVV